MIKSTTTARKRLGVLTILASLWLSSCTHDNLTRIGEAGHCEKNSSNEGWSLGAFVTAAVAPSGKLICAYDQGRLIDQVAAEIRIGELVASQACKFQGQSRREVFGVGSRDGETIKLRQAWIYDSKQERLRSLDPSSVECIYIEGDQ